MSRDDDNQYVLVGRISGLYGVRGWVKVYSHTNPRENIVGYAPWYVKRADGWVAMRPVEGRSHGKGVVAQLEGIDDREAAAALIGCDIAIGRDQLPQAQADEYYWADLVGLAVRTTGDVELGRVAYLFETGANDVMAVRGERERLLPFVADVVLDVDLAGGVVTVDWDPEF